MSLGQVIYDFFGVWA